MIGSRHILGLAIDDWGVVATEMSVRSGHSEVRAFGELAWKKELATENATELGDQLRRFLRDKGFSSNRVVVGLAAKWVLTREIDVPPASPDALAGMLGIQAERAFAINAGELVFDYCGQTSALEKRQITLFAAQRQVVDRIRTLIETAGLRIVSVTVSALACSEALAGTGPASRYGLYTRPTYCEFWSQSNGYPRFIRHVPLVQDGTPADYAGLLSSALQRMVLLSSGKDQSPPHRIAAYNACGLSREMVAQVNKQLGPQITLHDGRAGLQSLGAAVSDRPEAMRSIAATAMAMIAVEGTRLPVDFLNPRIGGKNASGRKRVIIWASSIAAVCLIVLGVVLADYRGDKAAIAAYTMELQNIGEDIVAAREIVNRVTYADSWTSREPRFLNCFRAMTEAFPERGSVWATSLLLNEDGVGSLVGKATDEASFYAVLDKIKGNKEAFSDVKMLYVRDAGRDSREKEFAISFTFQGAK
jgi:hypothetical protein